MGRPTEYNQVTRIISESKKNGTIMAKIWELACQVKELMTKKRLDFMKVRLNFSDARDLENVAFEFTHSELQDIVDPLFSRSEEIVDEVLSLSDWKTSDTTDLVLLGGTSKLTTIRDSIKLKFERAGVGFHNHVNPDNAIAMDATAVARQAVGPEDNDPHRFDDYRLHDKTSHSIGVEYNDGLVQVFAKKHTNVPSSEIVLIDATEGATGVKLMIREGESNVAKGNRLIGTFFLEEGTLHREGASFSLEWDIDVNFDLHLSLLDPERVREV